MTGNAAGRSLAAIGVRVEHPVPAPAVDAFTMNVEPLLHEVRHALARLLASGEPTVIDLGSLPLAPGELERIDATLGQGEVSARLDALGPSELRETRFGGVWRIVHRNAANEVVGQFIEVAHVPAVLPADALDLQAAHLALSAELATSGATATDPHRENDPCSHRRP